MGSEAEPEPAPALVASARVVGKPPAVTPAKVAMREWARLKNTEQAFSWAHEAMKWLGMVFVIDGTLDHGSRSEPLSALEDRKADELTE